ncbi:MAG: DUF5011 domain-containing protein [Carnobacterium sp.]|uniref:immunoglobulin-like domain-containing protein n=1 Tax=Carnobacterium sp. TaxID=48221 RepID=UPI002FC913A4
MSEQIEKPKKKKVLIYSCCAAVLIAISGGAYGLSQSNETVKTEPKTEVKSNKEPKIGNNKKNTAKGNQSKKSKSKEEKTDPFDKAVGLFNDGINYVGNSAKDAVTNLFSPIVAMAANDREEDKKDTPKTDVPLNLPGTGDPLKPNPPVVPPIIVPPIQLFAPVITNVEYAVIELNGDFNPYLYATVSDAYDSDIALQVDYSAVDVTQSGTYPVFYNATNSKGLSAVTKKTMVRVSARPVITTNVDSVSIPVRSNFNANDYVSAADWEDGDLTHAITNDSTVTTNQEGTFVVNYYVADSDGLNAVSKSITVYVTNEAPTISARPMAIQIDTEFNPMVGVSAYDKESGDLTGSIQVIQNGVDMSKEGTYSVTYFVEDGNGKDATVTRRVHVTNEAPVIHAEDKVFHVLAIDSFTMEMALEGVTISDREDGNSLPTAAAVNQEELAAIDVTTPGSYPLTYTVSDKHGKVSTKTIQIKIVNDNPIIEGAGDLVIHAGTAFDSLEGIVVSDTEEGSLLDRLVVVDLTNFDSNTPGTYQFSYTVEDSFGGRAEVIRTITVINDLPTILGASDKTIYVGDSFDPMAGITVSDTETSPEEIQLVVDGEVDTTAPGNYQLTYQATDGHGGVTEVSVIITVIEKDTELTPDTGK